MQDIRQTTYMNTSKANVKLQHRKTGSARLLFLNTTVILQFLQDSRLSRHAADMAQYKPGTAIGSTGGRG